MSKSDGVFIYIGTYASEVDARADYDVVKDLHAVGAVGTYDAAVVTKDDKGKIHVNKDETTTRHGAWGGAAAGALVGILFPPSIIGTAIVGAAIGGVSGHLWKGMSRTDVKEFGEAIDAGEAALVIVGETTIEDAIEKAALKAQKKVAKELQVDKKDRRHRRCRRRRSRSPDPPHARADATHHDLRPRPVPGPRAPWWRSRCWARRSRPSSSPRRAFRGLAQFVFALVYRIVVHRRNNRLARSLRRLYAPVALVSLPLVWMIFMMAAFTCIYWGTHDLSWSRAFEISVSSITTMGFSEPNGPGRIWIAFVEATIGLGLVALLISYLPTIYGAYNGREKGTNRLRPIAGSPPERPGVPADAGPYRRPGDPRHLAERGRLDARPRADAHRLPDPHLLPRLRQRAIVGRHHGDGARRVGAGLRRLRRGLRGSLR